MWILHFKNTAKILLGYAVNRSLKGADLIGGTFKVPTYIAYISARASYRPRPYSRLNRRDRPPPL